MPGNLTTSLAQFTAAGQVSCVNFFEGAKMVKLFDGGSGINAMGHILSSLKANSNNLRIYLSD